MSSLFHLAVFRAEGNLDYRKRRRSLGECIVTTIRFIICNLLRKCFIKNVIVSRIFYEFIKLFHTMRRLIYGKEEMMWMN